MVKEKRILTPQQIFRGVSLSLLPPVWPWPNVPKTGHPKAWRAGDDADISAGVPLSGPRFTDMDDGTVFDGVTGRMWVADTDLLGPPFYIEGAPQLMTWEEAIAACLALDYAGHTDWKLPNIRELMSLFFINQYGGHIDVDFFSVYTYYYWSSTTYVVDTAGAWAYEFVQGMTYLVDKDESTILALPVRGMPHAP